MLQIKACTKVLQIINILWPRLKKQRLNIRNKLSTSGCSVYVSEWNHVVIAYINTSFWNGNISKLTFLKKSSYLYIIMWNTELDWVWIAEIYLSKTELGEKKMISLFFSSCSEWPFQWGEQIPLHSLVFAINQIRIYYWSLLFTIGLSFLVIAFSLCFFNPFVSNTLFL